MASYISALSLLILVLINGCFTLPLTESQFSDLTTSSFDIDLTTAGYFHPRTIDGDQFATTEFNDMKRSENEEHFLETTPASTMSTNIKRSLSEQDDLEMTTSDVSQQERTNPEFSFERSSTFMGTTEDSIKQQREIETFTDGQTAEFLNTVSYEQEGQHDKRGLNDETETIKPTKESNVNEIESQFTTEFMPFFTSTSSAVAPELYTSESIDFASVRTSTKKYVGSFRENKHQKTTDEEDMEEPRKNNRKSEKEEEPKNIGAKTEGHEHDMPEEEHREEDDTHTDRKSKQSKSQKKNTEESFDGQKYAVGEFADQETLKNLQTVPSSVGFLDDSQKAVTIKPRKPSKTTTTTTEVPSENNLPQGE